MVTACSEGPCKEFQKPSPPAHPYSPISRARPIQQGRPAGGGGHEGPTHTDLTLLLLGTISSAATTESISAGLTDTILLL